MSRRLVIAAVAATMVWMTASCAYKARPARSPVEPLAVLSGGAYGMYLRGRVAVHEGRFESAVGYFRLAVARAPGEAPMRVALVAALVGAGHRAKARIEAERAQRDFPKSADVWLTSGRVYRGMRMRRTAVLAFRRALTLAPGDEQAYLGLAETLRGSGKLDQADAVYRALLKKHRDSIVGNMAVARRLLEKKHPRTALHYLSRVIEFDPDHVEARVALAGAQRQLGQVERAVATLRSAFDRSDGDPVVGEQLFRQLLDRGDRESAIELLGLLDRDDLEPSTRIAFGYMYLQIGETAAAMRLADELLTRSPRDGDARLLRAQALVVLGRGAEGLPGLLDMKPEETSFAQCRAYAAEVLARAGEIERALSVVRAARRSHPQQIDLVSSESLAHELAGHKAKARAILREALAGRPGNTELLFAASALEDRLGRPRRAEAFMARILRRDPNNPGALNFLGFSLADRGAELPRAEQLLRRAVALSPGNGYVLDSLGWLFYRQGHTAQALVTLRRAERLVPQEPEVLWHLGELLAATGHRDEATSLLHRALTLRPPARLEGRIRRRIRALANLVNSPR